MKNFIFFIFILSAIQTQNLFVDGVAAVVEDKIVLKSDLNQMVNMLAIQQKIDPTFIASVFTGVLASFGIQTASKKGDGTMKMNGESGQVSKKDMEQMIEKAAANSSVQTIRIEQAPLVIKAENPQEKDKYQM